MGWERRRDGTKWETVTLTIVEGLHGQALSQSAIRDGALAPDDYGLNPLRSCEPARRPFILSRWRRPLGFEHTRSLYGGEILLREEGHCRLPAPGIGLSTHWASGVSGASSDAPCSEGFSPLSVEGVSVRRAAPLGSEAVSVRNHPVWESLSRIAGCEGV